MNTSHLITVIHAVFTGGKFNAIIKLQKAFIRGLFYEKAKCYKKVFALSALMAFVITGSAYAESIKVVKGEIKNYTSVIEVGKNDSFENAGTVNATESIIINSGTFKNSGNINTKNLEILVDNWKAIEFNGGTLTADTITYKGTDDTGGYPIKLNDTVLVADQLNITDNNISMIGLGVSNTESLSNVNKINIISTGRKIALGIVEDSNVVLNSEIHLKGADTGDARVEVYSGATLTADKIIAESGKTKVQANGVSFVKLNNIVVNDEGDFSLQTNSSGMPATGGHPTFELNTITIGNDAEFKTSIYGNEPEAHITGNDVTINLGKNAKADFGGVGTYYGKDHIDNKTDWRGDKINFDVEKLTINVNGTDEYNYGSIDEYKDDYSKGVYIHVNDKYNPLDDSIGCGRITVIGSSSNNTGNLENDLQRLAYVVKVTREEPGFEANKLPEILAPTGATVEQNPGGIDDGGKGTVDEDGNVTDIETIKNPDVFGTEEVGALGLISWRNDLDDMNKRLGELRDSKGEHGVWVRMVRGENDYKSLNSQYNTYQLGYDEKLSTDPHWTLGAAFSYTDGDGGYDTGSFEMDHKTFTLYGSKLNDDGSYIDIVGKYSRLNHDLRNTWGDGEYDANGYSIGVEVGKRFQQGNGFWIEPQAQLTYGHVGSANYTAGDIKVAQDGMESLIGRAGVRFGKDLDNGNIYLRASYLYDFDGETGVTLTNAEGRERSFDQDLGGGWCEVGIGTNMNLSDATHLYFDIEKTYGGDITTDWKWNAGIRYSF